jgi:endonuclease-8
MPEGDTLARIAVALRPYLAGRVVTAARARLPGPQVSRIVGQKIDAVDAAGKNLLIKFDGGLELRTHLGLHGSWHRYRPGETWRRPPSRAALVIEVPGAIAVCFDAPVVELFERRAEVVHPTISMLGPDLAAAAFDQAEAVRRLRDPSRAATAIGEAVLDQRALAGIGNVFKSEVLFMERVDPFASVGTLDEPTVERVVATARELLKDNARPEAAAGRTTTVDLKTGKRLAPSRLWVYDRAGRPCHNCGTIIQAAPQGSELPRTTYWCPSCQAPVGGVAAARGKAKVASKG